MKIKYLAETLCGLLVTDLAGDAVQVAVTLLTLWKPGVADLTLVTASASNVLLAAVCVTPTTPPSINHARFSSKRPQHLCDTG